VEQSLLFQFAVSQGPYPLDDCSAVNIRFLFTVFEGVGVSGSLELADIYHSQETYCLFHMEVFCLT
jgi:hypothetical protein